MKTKIVSSGTRTQSDNAFTLHRWKEANRKLSVWVSQLFYIINKKLTQWVKLFKIQNSPRWKCHTTIPTFFTYLNIINAKIGQIINPNQTVLFSPLRNCGGEESRRSSFCHIILLSLDLGHLFLSTDIN